MCKVKLDNDEAAEDEHEKPEENAGEEPGDEEPDTDSPEEDEEPFDTYKLKIIQLCLDIGYGEPSHVEEMEGGSYNKIVGLTFPMFNNSLDNEKSKHCILRIPQRPLDDLQPNEISDQVSVLQFLSQDETLRVPWVLAYDMTLDTPSNANGCFSHESRVNPWN